MTKNIFDSIANHYGSPDRQALAKIIREELTTYLPRDSHQSPAGLWRRNWACEFTACGKIQRTDHCRCFRNYDENGRRKDPSSRSEKCPHDPR